MDTTDLKINRVAKTRLEFYSFENSLIRITLHIRKGTTGTSKVTLSRLKGDVPATSTTTTETCIIKYCFSGFIKDKSVRQQTFRRINQ